jgi:hypothetical protein
MIPAFAPVFVTFREGEQYQGVMPIRKGDTVSPL